MRKKDNLSKSTTKDGNSFKSKNKISREVRKLFKDKNKTTKAIRSSICVNRIMFLRRKLMNIEIELNNHYRKRNEEVEKKVLNKARTNKNSIYKYIKKKQNTKNIIGPFMKDNKVINGTPANILREQYCSVFTEPMEIYKLENPKDFFKIDTECNNCKNETVHECTEDMEYVSYLTDFTVSRDDIEKAIDKMSSNESSGPDGVPAIFYKKCKHTLSSVIAQIWNISLDQGKDPVSMKEAITLPGLKPDSDRTKPESYRPISLTPHLSKIFGRVMKDKLQTHLEKNNLIGNFQHGFRSE